MPPVRARRLLIGWLFGLGLGLPAATLRAQVRGAPIRVAAPSAYSTRIGLDLAHGGHTGGLTLTAGAEQLRYVGNCARLSLAAAGGVWNPPGEEFDAEFTGGAGATWLLNPCPRPNSAPNPEVRAMAGAGLTRFDGRSAWSVPLGIGLGYLVEVGVVRLLPWLTPRIQYEQSVIAADASVWVLAFSAGVMVGKAGSAGGHAAIDCCRGGLGAGYGLSLWF